MRYGKSVLFFVLVLHPEPPCVSPKMVIREISQSRPVKWVLEKGQFTHVSGEDRCECESRVRVEKWRWWEVSDLLDSGSRTHEELTPPS